MLLQIFFFVMLISKTLSEDKKWIWSESNKDNIKDAASRTAKDYLSRNPYEIYENTEGFGHIPSNYQQNSQYGGVGVLTGPSQGYIQDFDKCKCTEKFNCQSPGISYGQCDIGKKYCCYNSQGITGGQIPSKPVHSIANGILVGPGGPVDHVRPGINGYRPNPYQTGNFAGTGNNGYGQNHPGVLVGPRGPTGINNYGQSHPGVLVGPGGPTGINNYGQNHPGVLVGPGGPSGINNYGQNHPGVLVGPGGPTGIVGRPPYQNQGSGSIGRPPYYNSRPGNNFGELVSDVLQTFLGNNNRPYSNFGYGRSAINSENPDEASENKKP